MEYAVIIGLFLLLLFLGMPVAFTMLLISSGILIVYMGADVANLQIPQVMYNSLNNSMLVAIPAFILTGQIILQSGLGTRAFRAADAWFGHLPGGLAIATVITCAFFSALTGSSVATVLTLGYIASEEMIKMGYPKRLAYGVVAGAGTLGILIPPSGPMILYGAMTQESVGKLFMAGIIPGIVLISLFILFIVFTSRGLKRREKAPMKERFTALKEVMWLFLLPVIIIGGIYSGIFTVTEAAGVAAVVSILLAVIVYRSVGWKELIEVMRASAANTGMICFILGSALLFGFSITLIELPQTIQAYFEAADMNKWAFLALVTLILFVLGMFMEVVSILLIMTPILYPIMAIYGFDMIWFGIFMIIALEIAAITPPLGMNLFVMMQVSDKQGRSVGLIRMTKAASPYVALMIVLLFIITTLPALVTWLPSITDT